MEFIFTIIFNSVEIKTVFNCIYCSHVNLKRTLKECCIGMVQLTKEKRKQQNELRLQKCDDFLWVRYLNANK